jgi:plasmid stabilization system protein ParE
MARKIIWSFEATNDLKAIADYIAKDSPFYAAAGSRNSRCKPFAKEFSERGRVVPELIQRKRSRTYNKGYRLIYGIEESRVVILGIIHGKRDLKRLWEKEQREN